MSHSEIAVVGVSCLFPGGIRGLDQYWEALCEGRDCISDVPPDRWNHELFYDERGASVGGTAARQAGFLTTPVQLFEPQAFGLSPREASQMDPQQRLLLELAVEALEDARVKPADLSGTETGVYVGLSSVDYQTMQGGTTLDAYSMTGRSASVAANRISFCMNLRGPSLTVDTACSASLVAVHLACQALRNGECDFALAGGISLMLDPLLFLGFTRLGVLSPDSRCKSFDAGANGFARGEGGAVLALKTAARARADGDRIYGYVRASVMNQDGKTSGISQPSQAAQEALLVSAYRQAGLSPDQVSYVEAHGTGTAVGDPIEARALGAVLGSSRQHPLPIGSVKTNLGHLEAAAGLAGLLKGLLVGRHRQLVPHLHLKTPAVPLEELGLSIPTECRPLEAGELAYVGVSSFGFGGTNAHLILAVPAAISEQEPDAPPYLLPLSCHREGSLSEYAEQVAVCLEAGGHPGSVARTLRRRESLSRRLTVAGTTSQELAAELRSWKPQWVSPQQPVFVFCGQGSQWPGMGTGLLSLPPCRSFLEHCEQYVQKHAGWSVLDELTDRTPGRLTVTGRVVPALFVFQAALVEFWKVCGVVPSAVQGHSVGEVAAAYTCGMLDLDEALRVALLRGSVVDRYLPTDGGMLAVGSSWSALQPLAEELGLELAAVNSSESITLSGSPAQLEKLSSHLEAQGIFHRRLASQYSFHSSATDAALAPLESALGTLRARPPRIPWLSTVTGQEMSCHQLDAAYWCANVRQPVLLNQTIHRALDSGATNFIEVGPHPVLSTYLAECAAQRQLNCSRLPSWKRGEAHGETLLRSLGRLYEAGHPVRSGWVSEQGPLAAVPLRPRDGVRCWVDSPENQRRFHAAPAHPLLGRSVPEVPDTWRAEFCPERLAFLAEHRVQGQAMVPGAAWLEMMLAAARATGRSLAVENVSFQRGCYLDGIVQIGARISADGRCSIYSSDAQEEGTHRLHCEGRLTEPVPVEVEPFPSALCVDAAQVADPWFALSNPAQLECGPSFRGLIQAWEYPDQALGLVEMPAGMEADWDRYCFHPALLDACLSVGHHVRSAEEKAEMVVPTRVDRITWLRPPTRRLWVCTRKVRKYYLNTTVYSDDFQPVLLVEGAFSERLDKSLEMGEPENTLFELQWRLRQRPDFTVDTARWTSLPTPFQTVTALRKEWQGLPQTDMSELNRFAVSGLAECLKAMGWNGSLTELNDPQALAERLGVAATQRRLFARSLQLLQEYPECASDEFHEVRPAAPEEAMPDVLALVVRSLACLQSVLRGEMPGANVLAPSAETNLLEGFYRQSARRAQRAVAEVLEYWLADVPAEEPLRVLEVGAGTGSLTEDLLPHLVRYNLDYRFTDVSPVFLSKAQERFRSVSGLSFEIFDLDRDLSTQPYPPASFEVIVASHAVHVARNLRASLTRLAELLVDGGLLVLVDGTATQPYVHLSFGLSEGWWHFEDADLRFDGPMPAADTWRRVLGECGFEQPQVVEDCFQARQDALIVARRVPRPEPVRVPRPEPEGKWWVGSTRQQKLEAVRQDLQVAVQLAEDLDDPELRGVLFTAGLDCTESDCEAVVNELAALANRLSQRETPPQIVLLTAGAQAAGPQAQRSEAAVTAPAQAALWGFVRVLSLEYANLVRAIDLDPSWPQNWLSNLWNELFSPVVDDEVAYRGCGRYVPRLGGFRPADEAPLKPVPAPEFALRQETAGLPESLRLEARSTVPDRPAPGQVWIDVQAAGLNFSDVMKALGIYPTEGSSDALPLGQECTGTIRALGEGVREFQVGQRVMAVAVGAFASAVAAPAELVAPLPDALSWEAGATIPVVFLTAYFALLEQARLQPGETVLIHSATGGVGQAAVQLARRIGAVPLVTAGSEEKREFLRAQGLEHVFDSRGLGFVEGVRRATGGRGVDVVLNSLSGEGLRQSLALLAECGRFVEIGKRDIYSDALVGLGCLRKSISLLAVDLELLLRVQPARLGVMLRTISEGLERGELQAPPFQSWPMERAALAYRKMARAAHIGKLVFKRPENPLLPPPVAARQLQLDPKGTYLIPGGVGGVGLELGFWLASQGARRIVLTGLAGHKAGRTPEDVLRQKLTRIRQTGAEVVVEQADVADADRMRQLLADIEASGRPLRGVIHAAMFLQDGLLCDWQPQLWARVAGAKVRGSWLLHELTRDCELQFFVLLSSMATLMGTVGQCAYAAACAYQDGLSHYRRGLGLPALSVNLGYVGQVGFVARNDDVAVNITNTGFLPLTPEQVCEGLGRAIVSEQARLALFRVDWPRFRAQLRGLVPTRLRDLRFQEGSGEAQASGIRRELTTLPPEQARERLQRELIDLLSRTLHVDTRELDPHRSVLDYGVDSLVSVELRNWFASALSVSVPPVAILKGPTLEELCDYLLERIRIEEAEVPIAPPASAARQAEELLGRLDSMTEAEAERLLRSLEPAAP